MADLTPLTMKMIAAIRSIPRGRVATYGQVARLAGRPGASRTVVWVLHSCTKKYRLPWQRVISSQGKISFDPLSAAFQRQRGRLEDEGVVVDAMNGKIDLKRFQYKKKA